MIRLIKILVLIIVSASVNYSCAKKHACDCRYADGTSYNIIESSNGDCSEWNEPKKGITCKVVD